MSTAREIQIRQAESVITLGTVVKVINSCLDTMANDIVMKMYGREVCARRAAKIRRRGDNVGFVGRTKTGKARYGWMPALKITNQE